MKGRAMYRFCRLPLNFDVERLRADLEIAQRQEWTLHFVPQNYEGEWSAIPLQSIGGAIDHLYSDPAARPDEFKPTPILERCPCFQETLAAFQCDITSARLLKLAAGSVIKEHTDLDLSVESGVVRLHIPITTHPDVEFYVEEERAVMEPGSCWYLDATLPHRLNNPTDVDRVHIVFDCVMNDWLRERFQEGGFMPREKGALEQKGIREEDLPAVIAALRGMGTEVGERMARELESDLGSVAL